MCNSNTHYSSGCTDTCHCLDAECDKYTGKCPDKCDPGWRGGNKCNLGNIMHTMLDNYNKSFLLDEVGT